LTSPEKFEDVLKRWVRAEYMARMGANANWDRWARAQAELEAEMREMVTGHRDLFEAGESLGLRPQPCKGRKEEEIPETLFG